MKIEVTFSKSKSNYFEQALQRAKKLQFKEVSKERYQVIGDIEKDIDVVYELVGHVRGWRGVLIKIGSKVSSPMLTSFMLQCYSQNTPFCYKASSNNTCKVCPLSEHTKVDRAFKEIVDG